METSPQQKTPPKRGFPCAPGRIRTSDPRIRSRPLRSRRARTSEVSASLGGATAISGFGVSVVLGSSCCPSVALGPGAVTASRKLAAGRSSGKRWTPAQPNTRLARRRLEDTARQVRGVDHRAGLGRKDELALGHAGVLAELPQRPGEARRQRDCALAVTALRGGEAPTIEAPAQAEARRGGTP
jgi:hypothetical protein